MSDLEDGANDNENVRGWSQKHWKALQDSKYKDGYREGAGEDYGESLQRGFASGFHSACQVVMRLAILRGQLCALRCLDPDADARKFSQIIEFINQINQVEADVKNRISLQSQAETLDPSTLELSIPVYKTLELFLQAVERCISNIHQEP